jgi:ABC-type transport system involved in multi-copper enzyme maturation permease subunit
VPIHDQGYQHYTGARVPHGRAWWVIARAGLVERLRERRFLALMLFAWSPFAVRAVELYLGATILRSGLFAATEGTFQSFLSQQRLFVFFITIYAGAGLIASDRQSNALQIYLSKPIARYEYIAGKVLTLMLLLVAVTWLPAMLLLLLQILFSGSVDFLLDHPRLVPAITIVSSVQVSLASLMMVALSSLSRSRRFAAMVYAGVVLLAAAMDRLLEGVTGSAAWVLVSPQNTALLLADIAFGRDAGNAYFVLLAAIAVIAVMLASLFILERRVRAVEIVS